MNKQNASKDRLYRAIPYQVLVNAFVREADEPPSPVSSLFLTCLNLIMVIDYARVYDLEYDSTRDQAFTPIVDFAVALAGDLTLTGSVDNNLDRANSLALELVNIIENARDRATKLDRALSIARDRLHTPRPALSMELAYQNVSILRQNLSLARHVTTKIIGILGNYLDHQANITSIILKASHNLLDKGPTPDFWENNITPYLRAVTQLQQVIDKLTDQEEGEVRIAAMTRGSLDISFDGAARAIEVLLDTIVPWRRENAKTIAKLNEQEKQATVLKIQAEAEAESEAAAAKAREEVRKLQLENEKLQVELHEKRIDLALKVIEKLNPELPQAQKIGYVIQLLEPIKVITESPLQLVDSGLDGSKEE